MDKLTNKEEEVMEMIWQYGPCSPKDIVAIYPEPKPHVNTVATMFQFLEKKGFLSHEAKGRGYIYAPLISQNEYCKTKFSSFVDRYFDKSYMNVVSALVQEDKISRDELVAFLEQLKNN